MGHYDEFYEEHYAALRKDRQDRYEKVMNKFIELQKVLSYNSTDSIEYHLDMLDALIQREMR
jgi:hypothetical protein